MPRARRVGRRPIPTKIVCHTVLVLHATLWGIVQGAPPSFQVECDVGRLKFSLADTPLATYVYRDDGLSRPYWAHVCARDGRPVTRRHPPDPAVDDTDHGTPGEYFHPGIWLAFSDRDGADDWRLKVPVTHGGFVDPPQVAPEEVTFTVRNRYAGQGADARGACVEQCRYTLRAHTQGWFLVSDSLFAAERAVVFGDAEEMGWGVRVATPLAVRHGGRLVDALGRKNEAEIWGRASDWCDASGVVDGGRLGVLVLPDPANFRPCRFHARDYGLCAANPFGQRVFGATETSGVMVAPGRPLRLRCGFFIYSEARGGPVEPAEIHAEFCRQLTGLARP